MQKRIGLIAGIGFIIMVLILLTVMAYGANNASTTTNTEIKLQGFNKDLGINNHDANRFNQIVVNCKCQ